MISLLGSLIVHCEKTEHSVLVVRDKTYDKFLDWLRHHNFPKSKLVLAEFPGK